MKFAYKKSIYSTLLACCIAGAQSFVAAAEPEQATQADQTNAVEQFVENIGNEIITILVHRHQPMEVRKKNFRAILNRDFDMPSIGKFVIARYWRTMSPQQKEEYLYLFVDAVVENYASQFNNYNNEKLKVKHSRRSQDGGFVVLSEIYRPGKGAPLKVEWKIFITKRGKKVVDIIVDGVSMSITLRSEYASVYNDRGGVEGLLRYLRQKIEKSTVQLENASEG